MRVINLVTQEPPQVPPNSAAQQEDKTDQSDSSGDHDVKLKVGVTTLLIACPGDRNQTRREALWTFQLTHRGIQPSIRLPKLGRGYHGILSSSVPFRHKAIMDNHLETGISNIKPQQYNLPAIYSRLRSNNSNTGLRYKQFKGFTPKPSRVPKLTGTVTNREESLGLSHHDITLDCTVGPLITDQEENGHNKKKTVKNVDLILGRGSGQNLNISGFTVLPSVEGKAAPLPSSDAPDATHPPNVKLTYARDAYGNITGVDASNGELQQNKFYESDYDSSEDESSNGDADSNIVSDREGGDEEEEGEEEEEREEKINDTKLSESQTQDMEFHNIGGGQLSLLPMPRGREDLGYVSEGDYLRETSMLSTLTNPSISTSDRNTFTTPMKGMVRTKTLLNLGVQKKHKKTFTLKDMTATFRDTMQKSDEALDNADSDREWFENILNTKHTIVDESSYDTFAHRGLKHRRTSQCKVSKPKPIVESLPNTDFSLARESAGKCFPVFPNINSDEPMRKAGPVKAIKTRSKHSKLKLALSNQR